MFNVFFWRRMYRIGRTAFIVALLICIYGEVRIAIDEQLASEKPNWVQGTIEGLMEQ